MKILCFFFSGFLIFSCANREEAVHFEVHLKESINSVGKITGVNLEMPSKIVDSVDLDSVNEINAKWVSLVPYGFTRKGSNLVEYGAAWQWWGETVEGTISIANAAHAVGQKVMIKPHVWVVGDGWPGEFDLTTEKEWKEWEESYKDYILTFAKVADSVNAELFCVGTEYRYAARKREDFWRVLIKEVRKVYTGPITYASNWDNYESVQFWDALDYIGIDGYFPVSKEKTPSYQEVKKGWEEVTDKLNTFSLNQSKQILFTEYGFKSSDYAVSGMQDEKTNVPNMGNQFNAYRAFFETIWGQDFFAGGFLWKWTFFRNSTNSGEQNARYTPQGKPAFNLIRQVYSRK